MGNTTIITGKIPMSAMKSILLLLLKATIARTAHFGSLLGGEMTIQEKIDEMYRQLETTNPKSKKKIRDLKKGIEKARRQKRRELRGGTIII